MYLLWQESATFRPFEQEISGNCPRHLTGRNPVAYTIPPSIVFHWRIFEIKFTFSIHFNSTNICFALVLDFFWGNPINFWLFKVKKENFADEKKNLNGRFLHVLSKKLAWTYWYRSPPQIRSDSPIRRLRNLVRRMPSADCLKLICSSIINFTSANHLHAFSIIRIELSDR